MILEHKAFQADFSSFGFSEEVNTELAAVTKVYCENMIRNRQALTALRAHSNFDAPTQKIMSVTLEISEMNIGVSCMMSVIDILHRAEALSKDTLTLIINDFHELVEQTEANIAAFRDQHNAELAAATAASTGPLHDTDPITKNSE